MEIVCRVSRKSIRFFAVAAAIFSVCSNVQSQSEIYNYYYRVYFRDKGDYDVNSFFPRDLLSEKAIARRHKANITVPDFNDLPVFGAYINQIVSMGYKLHCTSKWMNTGLFKTQSAVNINSLINLSFVKDVRIVKKPAGKSPFENKLDFTEYQADIPPFDRSLTMLNGTALHNSGYDGTGILIAILDGGFINSENISSLNHLRSRNGIRGTYDFVLRKESVYDYHNHGTAVLSILAGSISQVIEGSSPGADFWLLRTEDTFSEFPVEEDFWAAGAEFADSIGADIISSSLGYSRFDDPTMDYKFSDMDGNTTFVTQAADFAASKGILVVNSAGNERTSTWKRIIAPSDGDRVIAAGAVDGSNLISIFSSAGPSVDGRIKPDNVALGVSVTVQTLETTVGKASGTSFSCPVLSGMCACVLQAVPEALNTDIIRALHISADRYNSPDSLYGYGIPDMSEVVSKLQEMLVTKPGNETIIGPNPFTGDLEIIFKKIPETLILEIFTASGVTVFRRNYKEYIGRTLKISDLQNMGQGLYFVRLITANKTITHKVIKLNN
jgi:serine protease AprX